MEEELSGGRFDKDDDVITAEFKLFHWKSGAGVGVSQAFSDISVNKAS